MFLYVRVIRLIQYYQRSVTECLEVTVTYTMSQGEEVRCVWVCYTYTLIHLLYTVIDLSYILNHVIGFKRLSKYLRY